MIIDCHGHYTGAPAPLRAWRDRQLKAFEARSSFDAPIRITDDEIRETLEKSQVKAQRERGTDVTLFSPIAGQMGHHFGDRVVSERWTRVCNDLVHRACELYPSSFIGVCQLPQSPGVSPANCVEELKRCVDELGFVGCNLSPDPSGGHWTDPPLHDRYWYPLYEALCALDVPAMIHVSGSCNPCFHGTGAHYINGDTTAFMQCLTHGQQLFRDFPTLRFVIPHGGGAVPYHWGRYRGLAQDMGKPPLAERVLKNVYFDTCVYHQAGIDLLLEVIPKENILFASEMIGAVRGIDPETGHHYDDTRRYIDGARSLSTEDRHQLFTGNVLKVYPRLAKALAARGLNPR